MKKIALVFGLLLFSFGSVFSQQTNNWYFGSAAGFANTGLRIDFGSGSPQLSTNIPMLTEEGTSAISDASGNPLFYTDGIDAWNATTNVKFNTFALGGNSSTTQSAIIVPKPGNSNQWLLFTKAVNNGSAQYVTVQKTGAVYSIVEGAPVALVPNATTGEGMYIIGSTKANSSYWVLFRETGTTGLVRAYEITNTGVVNTSAVTSTLSGPSFTNTNYDQFLGIIKSNSCQNKLAFTYFNGAADIVDFNPATGQVVTNTANRISITGNSYGIEFSPNDQYLYVTALTQGNIYQYNISTSTNSLLATIPNEAGQLQLAPDNKIYMAIQKGATSPSYLGVINAPNSATPNFVANGFLLSGILNSSGNFGFSYRGLPTFPRSLTVSSLFLTPGDTTVCTNTDIKFRYFFGGSASSQTWSITPGTAGTNWSYTSGTNTSASPTVRFLTANTYRVIVTITDICSFTYKDTMDIVAQVPLVPSGTVTCSGTNLILDNPATDPNEPKYIWYKNSVSPSNIIGVGTPFNYATGNDSYKPSSICVGIASAASITTATNKTLGPTANPTNAPNTSPYVSPTFDVLADNLVIRSFKVKFYVCPAGGNLTFTVKNMGGTIVYQQTKAITSCAINTEYTVPVNFTLTVGNDYTFTLDGTGAEYYRQAWGGATNAGEARYDPEVFGGTTSLYNIVYDAYTFNVTPTCATTTCYSVACSLPLDLLSFSGEELENSTRLTWTSANEVNTSKFVIEKSLDGADFYKIGTVFTQNNSQRNTYTFEDKQMSSNTYYRLAIFDIGNQTPTYSKAIFLSNTNVQVLANPNPFDSEVDISIFNGNNGTLILTNIVGNIVEKTGVFKDQINYKIGAKCSSGLYFATYMDETGKQTSIKLIKQ